jgi:peptidoglycan/xylan/chitin deacetylase (PgdA/CDA1 family)/glycosyltransferase involved in cell wall biosynthesis
VNTSQTAVVITCYDLGATVPEAVDSLAAQTVKPLEIVLVDDGSQDALTRHVVDWLDAYDPAVSVIRSAHRGVAHARNLGIASTSAPHVVLLDGDDLFEPTYLEQAEELLRQRPDLGFVCCALQAFGRASYRWKPPPYTVADAVARGACGHISTVFRRGIWNAVGGFDDALPAYEDVDFWLRALELGFRGAILDDALLRYRVRHGSRYHSTVVRGGYLRAKELLLAKHAEAVRARGEDVFVSLFEFQREIADHGRWLDDEHMALAQRSAAVEDEVTAARDAVTSRRIPPFDWGRLDEALWPGRVRGHAVDVIENHYAARARQEHGVLGESNRTLLVHADSRWSAGVRKQYDTIVVCGALEHVLDPAAMLGRCRDELRPGGALLVTVSTMALGAKRRHGFTESAMRKMLCELFPPAQVTTTCYGNLLTCIASAAGAPLTELTSEEIDVTDPSHPTLVVASARLPRGRRFRGSQARPAAPNLPPQRPVGSRGVILCYHRIGSLRPDVHSLCIPPDLFTAQMELIARRYRPVALEDLAAQVTAGELAACAVAVTFDDGYADNLEIAAPILAAFGVPATFFVSGAATEEPREAWWDTMERIFLGDEEIPAWLSLEVGEIRIKLETRTGPHRLAALFAIHGHLLDAEGDQIAEVEREVAAWSGLELAVRSSHRLMTTPEIVELSERPGQQIGAHGLDHLRLSVHPSEVQAADLRGSKSRLERLLEKPVTTLAYPYGACDLATTQIAERTGFDVGCTVEGEALTSDSDPLRLPRVEASAARLAEFELQLQRLLDS